MCDGVQPILWWLCVFVLFRVDMSEFGVWFSEFMCEECVECAWANEVRIAQLAQAPV